MNRGIILGNLQKFFHPLATEGRWPAFSEALQSYQRWQHTRTRGSGLCQPCTVAMQRFSTSFTSEYFQLPFQTPSNFFFFTRLRTSSFCIFYLSAMLPSRVAERKGDISGHGHTHTHPPLSSCCSTANLNIVLLLVKSISKSLSSIRFRRADVRRVEARDFFFPF